MPRISDDTLFRYQIVSQVLAHMRAGFSRAKAVRCVASRAHVDLNRTTRLVSIRSVYRWLSAFEESELSGLATKKRTRVEESLVLPQVFLDFLVREKQDDVQASIPEIIRRAKELGHLTCDVDRTTVYRAARRLGVCVQKVKSQREDRDTLRFAYPHRLDMVLCDGKHFRAGVTRARRVALIFLDDCTRYFLHAVIGTSENAALFLRGLYEMIRKYGHFSIMFLDNGPGFIANDTASVISALPAHLIHGESAYPAGHGKIERFNQTTLKDLLRGWDGREDIDPDCSSLELRLLHYGEEIYNHRPHSSLTMQTPWERFHNDSKPLTFPHDDTALRSKFEVSFDRRVSNDHVVSVDSVFYEVPRGYHGRFVELRRKLLDCTLHFLHEGRLIELHPVDPEKNARLQRARPRSRADETGPAPKRSAADMNFESDLGSVVDRDGGFQDDATDQEEKP